MSADNQMVVVRSGDRWHVYMQLGDNPYDEAARRQGAWFKEFDNKTDAVDYAQKICEEEVVEYGIRIDEGGPLGRIETGDIKELFIWLTKHYRQAYHNWAGEAVEVMGLVDKAAEQLHCLQSLEQRCRWIKIVDEKSLPIPPCMGLWNDGKQTVLDSQNDCEYAVQLIGGKSITHWKPLLPPPPKGE